jgi:hypothetical protein
LLSFWGEYFPSRHRPAFGDSDGGVNIRKLKSYHHFVDSESDVHSTLRQLRSVEKETVQNDTSSVHTHVTKLKSADEILIKVEPGVRQDLNSGSQNGDFQSRKLLGVNQQGFQSIEGAIVTWLKDLQSKLSDVALLDLSCGAAKAEGVESEWGLCADAEKRKEMLLRSTFALIISPVNDSIASTVVFQTRLYEALKFGAIPVLLGSRMHLPYAEILNWDRALVSLPLPRVTEIPFFLRTFTDSDISAMKVHGRFLWETYFGSTKAIVDTTLAVLRTRLMIIIIIIIIQGLIRAVSPQGIICTHNNLHN